MIREISKNDLTDDYFLLLSQLSGTLTGYSVYNIWEAYLKGSSKTYVFINDDNQIIGSATIFIEHKFLHCGSTIGHIEDVVVDEIHLFEMLQDKRNRLLHRQHKLNHPKEHFIPNTISYYPR